MKKEKINLKNGISLIVLVITIIVMLILAGTIIISLSNNNVIDNANNAVLDTEMANIRTEANMVYADYMLEKSNKDINEYMSEKLKDTIKDKYIVKVIKEEIVIAKKGTAAYMFLNGDIKIGDDVIYDPTDDGKISKSYTSKKSKNLTADQTFTNSYNGTWKVIGVSEEGNLKIAASTLETNSMRLSLNSSGDITCVMNIVNELNNACEIFGYGRGAILARSINLQDISTKKFRDISFKIYWKRENGNTILHAVRSKDAALGSSDKVLYIKDGIQRLTIKPTDMVDGETRMIDSFTYQGPVIDSYNQELLDTFKDTYFWIANHSIGSFKASDNEPNVSHLAERVHIYYNNTLSNCYIFINDFSLTNANNRMSIKPVVYLDKNVSLFKNNLEKWEMK